MEQKFLYVDGEVLWAGVRKASSRSEEPILCLIKPGTIRFVALSGLRLVVSWEAKLRRPAPGNLAFTIPPTVADLLSSEVIRSQAGVSVTLGGDGDVTLRLTDHLGSYEIRWQSDLASFPAPSEFSKLVKMPQALIDVPYLKISDAAHQAVAKLARMESESQIDRTKLAILVTLDLGRLTVNGQEIVGTGSSQYYFDPRLVIRALEVVRERIISVGITPLAGERRAYISLLAKQEGWTVHCSLLSIGMDTQKLYPLPQGRNQ
jgi:hypothetical protein